VRRIPNLVCLITLLFLPTAALAQESAPDAMEGPAEGAESAPWERVRIGLKAGATWSTLRGEFAFEEIGSVPFKGDFGFAVGVSAEIPVSTKLSLQPAAFLVRKLSRLEVDAIQGGQKLSVNYLEFPLLLKWYPGNRAGVQGNIVIGPMPSLRTGATREIRLGNSIEDVDASDLVNGLDWAIVVGGGFEFDELLGAFTVDLRYSHGLRDVAAAPGEQAARWSVLQMVVGITL
jgi:hypothetical protein